MNLPEAANEVLESAKLRLAIAAGKPVAIVMHTIVVDDKGHAEGMFTTATFTPDVATIMPIIQALINSVVQQGAQVNGHGH